MNKIFALLVVLALSAVFIVGCADDGKDGVAGITGTGGCDYNQIFDEELGFCVTNPDYVVHVQADHQLTDHADFDPDSLCEGNTAKPKWDPTTGACIAN